MFRDKEERANRKLLMHVPRATDAAPSAPFPTPTKIRRDESSRRSGLSSKDKILPETTDVKREAWQIICGEYFNNGRSPGVRFVQSDSTKLWANSFKDCPSRQYRSEGRILLAMLRYGLSQDRGK